MPGKSKGWLRERKEEPYYRRSKREGYRSRATYKLQQIDNRFKILRKGYKILDFGAAPGGWLQYAAEAVGDSGFVLGVDIREIPPLPYSNVKTIQLDIEEDSSLDTIYEEVDGRVHVLLSDISPNISGAWDVDVAKQVHLCERAVDAAERVLVEGGSMVAKIFQGRDSERVIYTLRKRFKTVKLFRPPSTKKGSSEIYAVCLGFKRAASPTASMNR